MSYSLRDAARLLALSILDSAWDRDVLAERLSAALHGGPPNPHALAVRLLSHFGSAGFKTLESGVEFLEADPPFRKRFSDRTVAQPRITIQLEPSRMHLAVRGLDALALPLLHTVSDLADWLGISASEADWFAGIDRRYEPYPPAKRDHYRYEWRSRRTGGPRLLEKPKPRLKAIQRQILRELLAVVPTHMAAHGFCRGRSIRSSVLPHVRQPCLLRLDLQAFFPSIGRARVEAVFRALGYPQRVSRSLAGLCCHRTPATSSGPEFMRLPWESRQRLRNWHLPQGAPSSPVLANLCAMPLDRRIGALTASLGLNYTRYADDLAISGSGHCRDLLEFVQPLIGAIALEEGFRLNHRKTRVMTAAQRQRFCGVTVNATPNLDRREYDTLKATLYNCAKSGPASQNRLGRIMFRDYLRGRVSHVEFLNPQRGAKLRILFEKIRWDD